MRIKDHNLNPETVETQKENIGKKKMKENIGNILQVVRVSQDFPKRIPFAKEWRQIIGNCTLTKPKVFHTAMKIMQDVEDSIKRTGEIYGQRYL